MIKFLPKVACLFILLTMAACGGSTNNSANEENSEPVEKVPFFELKLNQEVFIDTLEKDVDVLSVPHPFSESKEYATRFATTRSTSINQITWFGVISASEPTNVNALNFRINVYKDDNGIPQLEEFITRTEIGQAQLMASLNDTQSVYAFDINKSNLFDLSPNNYHISISLIDNQGFSYYALASRETSVLTESSRDFDNNQQNSWQVLSSVRKIRIAGSCIGPCKLDQIGSVEDDILVGDELSNHFKGNGGDDYLIGGYGDDFYYFSLGDGKDVISEFDSMYELPRPEIDVNDFEGTGDDSVIFMPGIEVDQLDIFRQGLDLKIAVYETEDEILLKNWFLDDTWQVEYLTFSKLGRFYIRYQGFNDEASYMPDWLGGDEYSNTLYGLEWKDILSGRQGDDFLYGGSGDDLLIGGPGADFLDGGSGWDTISYHDSNEGISIFLDNSSPSLGGTAQGDSFNSIESIFSTEFDDVISTTAAAEIIKTLGGNDTIYSMSGGDKINSGDGNDYISSGIGGNIIFGKSGDDEIYSERSIDIISGGRGNDILSGGGARDIYLFGNNFGIDKVIELKDRRYSDDIVLSGFSFDDIWFFVEGENLIIEDLNSDNRIELVNYSTFNIVFDSSNYFRSIEQEFMGSQLSITASNDTVLRINYRDLELIIKDMERFDRADAKDVFPESVLKLYDLNVREVRAGRIITESKINNYFDFQMSEDSIFSGSLSVKDNNGGEDFLYKIVKNSDFGHLTIENDGTVNFIPLENFHGNSSMYLEFEDALGFLNRFRIVFSVTAVDDPGTIKSDISIVTKEEEDVFIDIGFNDVDDILGNYTVDVSSSLGNFVFDSFVGFVFKPFDNAYGKENVVLKLTDRLGRVLESNISIHVIGVNDFPA